MDDLLKILQSIERETSGAGIRFELEANRTGHLRITGGTKPISLRIVRLYRPSSQDIESASPDDALLILTRPTEKALAAAGRRNYIHVPNGGYRIVTRGIALSRTASPEHTETRSSRLAGRSGVVAETILLQSDRRWTVGELADRSKVSSGLAHRVLSRLEDEHIMRAQGSGPAKVRVLHNASALAELWSQEESPASTTLRGYLYASSEVGLLLRLMELIPGGAAAALAAANTYEPLLTQLPSALKIWAPATFDASDLKAAGFQHDEMGANIEILFSKGDPWSAHVQSLRALRLVSPWRAWTEISHLSGRSAELAQALRAKLQSGNGYGRN